MPPIYVSQQGAQVRTQGGRLLAVYHDEKLLDLPIEEVDQLTVLGRGIQVSTAALVTLLERGVEVCFLSEHGRFLGKFSASGGAAPRLRLLQYEWVSDRRRALSVARLVVVAKLTNQKILLTRLAAHRTATQVQERIHGVNRTADLDQLRGLEGAAASSYFQALAPFFPAGFNFRGRAHHPPPDPINAALSFGYTLLLKDVISSVSVVGLDPYLGFLHAAEPGRPSLALDLEEEFRPAVDDFVLDLFRRGELRQRDYTRESEGIRLEADARKRFLRAYEAQLALRLSHPLAHGKVTLRQAIELQVRQLVRSFANSALAFEPVRLAEIWREDHHLAASGPAKE